MRVVLAVICLCVLATLLTEFFVVFLLPRRVRRDPRIARGTLRALWRPYRAGARRLGEGTDTMLGVFGPLGLLAILGMLSAGVILSYAGLLLADHVGHAGHAAGFGTLLYLSAGIFFSASTPWLPNGPLGHVMQVAEAATGFGFLAIAIGYLPALFQAFSRRETAVSLLDPRAGSPPSAGALLEGAGRRGGWSDLDTYLGEWETWTAELMETHLSYPILGYFRSQHVNQNWLAALTTVVDASAYALVYGPTEETHWAELTFRIGRHALADLALAFDPRWRRRRGGPTGRLSPPELEELRGRLDSSGLASDGDDDAAAHLERLRGSYEPQAVSIARSLALELPGWLPDQIQENWREAAHADPRRRGGLLT